MIVTKILKPFRHWKYFDAILLFFGLLPLFWFLVYNVGGEHGDYSLHLKSIVKVNNGESTYTPHFLFFFLVNLFSGFSSNMDSMYRATIVLLTCATVMKYIVSKELVLSYAKQLDHVYKNRVVKVLTFGLLFVFAIPDFYNFFVLRYMYLGRIPPNLWHNSTLTLLFPFALLLFRQHLIISGDKNVRIFSKNIGVLIFLIFLNIIIKPSFLFVYFPVAGLIILNDFRLKRFKESLVQSFPLMVGSLMLLIQYVYIYIYQTGSFKKEASGLTIGMPFEFLRSFMPYWYIPIGHLFSFLLPFATIYSYRDILKYKPFVYSLLYTIVGLLISIFVIEEGPRKYHGNFTWQNIVCMYLLMLSICMYLFPKLFTKELVSRKMLILIGIFVLQFLSGLLYLVKLYYTGGLFS